MVTDGWLVVCNTRPISQKVGLSKSLLCGLYFRPWFFSYGSLESLGMDDLCGATKQELVVGASEEQESALDCALLDAAELGNIDAVRIVSFPSLIISDVVLLCFGTSPDYYLLWCCCFCFGVYSYTLDDLRSDMYRLGSRAFTKWCMCSVSA